MKPCVKQKFASKHEAEARAAWLWLVKPHKFAEPMREYACTPCGKWHLTHTRA